LHHAELANQPPKLAYSVPEAMAAMGLGRNTIYDLISSGRLHSIKVGSRRIIPASALHEFLEGAAA
jgi:excisionase family DNA binding protein